MDFFDSLAAKGFTIVGVLTLVSILLSFVPGGLGFAPILVTLIVAVTWALFLIGGYNNDKWEFSDKEIMSMSVVGAILGIVGLGAFGFDVIPQFTSAVSQLGIIFSAGLLPLALGTSAGLITNTILGSAKRFMG